MLDEFIISGKREKPSLKWERRSYIKWIKMQQGYG